MQLKITSFNIRTASAMDGRNAWKNRRTLVLKSLAEQDSDLLCFQEVVPSVKEFLRRNLPAYTLIGENRKKDFTDECTPIAYKTWKFDLLDASTFWLSPTPSVPGSMFRGSVLPRVCTVLTLRFLDSAKLFRVFNTHLDHLRTSVRLRQEAVLAKKIRRYEALYPLPYVITGDFNALPGGPVLTKLFSDLAPGLQDASAPEKIGSTYTFHGYFKKEPLSKIDYIMASSGFQILDSGLDTRHENDLYLSDHYPVFTSLRLK